MRRNVSAWALSALLTIVALPFAGPASAAPSRAATYQAVDAATALLLDQRVVAAARAQRGKPYRHGAEGPRAFDCSGLTTYAYRTVRVNLPRTANAQYRAAHPVSRAAARPGDLVFWLRGGRAYHVGVYAGAGRVWHAPKPGDRVRLATIWSPREVRFGRVIG